MFLKSSISSLLLAIAFVSCVMTSGSDATGRNDAHIADYKVPVFTIQDLRAGSRRNELEHILATTGLLSLVGSSQDMSAFEKARQDAFSGLCTCTKRESGIFASVQGFDSSLLSDETTRMTLATATVGSTPLPLDMKQLEEAGCGTETVQSLDSLRDFVAWASKWFVASLDEILKANGGVEEGILGTDHGKRYNSIASVVKESQNLEHFHVYTKPGHSTETFDLDFHTDAGLFLTFVPGFECGDMEAHMNESQNFYIQVDGTTYRAIFEKNSIAVMLGAGAEHWLQTSTTLKATSHAVVIPSGKSRAWYGMMHLVPQNVIIQDFPRRTFADMRKAMVHYGTNSRAYSNIEGDDVDVDNDISIGCGTYSTSSSWMSNGGETRINRRRLQMVDSASACNNATNFYCWMSCLSIPDSAKASEKLKEGLSLYCLDESELATTNNVSAAYEQCNSRYIHNDGCAGAWLPTVSGVPSQEVIVDKEVIEATPVQFCYGGTSMFMDGFHWMNPTCVIYLFPSWVLDSAGLLTAASIGTLFFGVVLEGVISKRRSVVQSFPLGWKRLTISTLFYGLQLTLGYLLMLVVMTYSGPLFMCVIFGLMGGHFIFNAGGLTSSSKPSTADNETEEQCGGSFDNSNDSKVDIPEGFTPVAKMHFKLFSCSVLIP